MSQRRPLVKEGLHKNHNRSECFPFLRSLGKVERNGHQSLLSHQSKRLNHELNPLRRWRGWGTASRPNSYHLTYYRLCISWRLSRISWFSKVFVFDVRTVSYFFLSNSIFFWNGEHRCTRTTLRCFWLFLNARYIILAEGFAILEYTRVSSCLPLIRTQYRVLFSQQEMDCFNVWWFIYYLFLIYLLIQGLLYYSKEGE